MRITAAFLALALTLPAFGDAVEEVRQAETNFAKAFADRDKAKFFSFVAPDAVFISALGTLRGRDAIVARWSRMFDNVPVAPFSWGPERVEVTADGKIGFSMGPIYDPQGKHAGYYSSIWQKQADGSWKIIVDGPGNPPAPILQNAAKLEEGFVPTADGGKLYYRKLTGGPVTIIAPLDFVFHEPLQQFADIATIITFDPRNRGRSSRIQPATIAKDVEDLETIRTALKVDKFVPLGWSYFGKVVAMYAAAHPEHVSRVIQLGPAANDMKQFPGGPEEDFGAPDEDVKAMEAMRQAGAAKEKPAEFCDAWWKVVAYRMVGDPKHASRFDRSFCSMEN